MPRQYSEKEANEILGQILKSNVGLRKVYGNDGASVMFASPERILASKMFGGGGHLEFWPSEETGTDKFPHPNPGKIILEIYNQQMRSNPVLLRQAIYGDLLHGMSKDPQWSGMREEFKSNYTPEELERITQKRSWWSDANGTGGAPNSGHDAYIRGWLNEPDIALRGQQRFNNTMYSPKQIEILNKMQHYIKTGIIR